MKRYRWMRGLGNAKIGRGSKGIKIAEPAAAEELLRLVIDAANDERHVIFFCACSVPGRCHRTAVAHLLVKAARRQNLRLTAIEWPGGEPKTLELPVSDSVIRRVLRGGNRVPLPGSRPQDRRKLLDLPWCSRLMLAADDTRLAIISGPAQFASARPRRPQTDQPSP